MRFAIIGGDLRQIIIARNLQSKANDVLTFGLGFNEGLISAKTLNTAILKSDAIILPLPVSRDGISLNAPLSDEKILLEDILKLKPKLIFGGIISEDFEKALKQEKIEFYDYYKSEALTVKNAVLTAEAAIAIAIKETKTSLFGSKSLVIGYGRIGKILSRYLKALGSTVTATSRSRDCLAVIESDGFKSLSTNRCRENAADYDYIFNTVPFPIMDDVFFNNCNKDTFIEDLATDSGTDFDAAKQKGINAMLCSSLPGRFSPKKAGAFITEEILNYNDCSLSER